MFENHLIELLTPKQSVQDLEGALEKFARKYERGLESGYVLSVPDNPMGGVRFRMSEVLDELGLPVVPERLVLHLNTFHTKQDLDRILTAAEGLGIRYVLAVSGDGGKRLPKLNPETLGSGSNSVSSVELLRYMGRAYPDRFVCGVAFNPYEPQDHEMAKFERKLDAGARFVVTQPVIGYEAQVARLERFQMPVVVGAWMSGNVELLSQCVGYALPELGAYDPVENLKGLQQLYPAQPLYLSVLDFERQLACLRSWLRPPARGARYDSFALDTAAPRGPRPRADRARVPCYTGGA